MNPRSWFRFELRKKPAPSENEYLFGGERLSVLAQGETLGEAATKVEALRRETYPDFLVLAAQEEPNVHVLT